MPSINLPTITINKEDFKSKETMENILDTLMKYRKELNYLLMNLDVDNMPSIGGLMEDMQGNYSLLTQTVDGIYMQVGNIQGDIADFRVEADNISAMVANNSGNIAALVIEAGQIQTTVTNLNTTVGGFASQITQNANNISSIVSFTDVSGYQIASKISQSPTAIDLIASNINIVGVTRIVSPTHDDSYAEFSSMTDFTLYAGGNPVFTVYNGIDYAGLKSFGVSHLRLGYSKAIAEGEWDFQGTVKGLTARFG